MYKSARGARGPEFYWTMLSQVSTRVCFATAEKIRVMRSGEFVGVKSAYDNEKCTQKAVLYIRG